MLEKSFILPMDMCEFLTMSVSPIEVNCGVFWPHDVSAGDWMIIDVKCFAASIIVIT